VGGFLCADVAWRRNALMSIEVVTARLGVNAARWLRVVNLLVIAVFLVYVIVLGLQLGWTSRVRTIAVTARRLGYAPERATRPTLRELGTAVGGGFWALMFPVILLLGLRFGTSFAMAYAVLVGAVVYRSLGRRELGQAVEASLSDIGSVIGKDFRQVAGETPPPAYGGTDGSTRSASATT
jgi:hypothetical protein